MILRWSSLKMALLLLWFLVLRRSILTGTLETHCTLQNNFEPGFVAGGDFVIGGIFPLHYNQEMPDLNCSYKPGPVQCNGFDPRAFRWALTMKLAVEEINNSTELLPNHTLGYKIFDSCAYPLTGQRAALAVMNGPAEADKPMCSSASPMLAIIGESGSAQSIVVSRILQPFRIPMGLLNELEDTSVCVAYQEMIPLLYDSQRATEIIQVMNSSSARVVVVFSAEGELTPFLKDYMKLNVTGIQWIASEAWVTASVFTGSEYYPFLGGTIGYGIRQGYIPKLKDYIMTVNPEVYPSNPLVQELWGALYGCSPVSSFTNFTRLPTCTGQELLNTQHSAYMNTSSPRIAYNVYKGVYAIAHSLHNLISCKPGTGPFNNSMCADSTKVYPWQLQHYLQEVSFTISGETVNFDMNGDSIPSYDLINWQKGTAGNIELVKVGMYDGAREAGSELVIYDMAITWARDKNAVDCLVCPEDFWSNEDGTECIPKLIEFLSHDAMGLTLTVIAIVGACVTLVIFGVFLYHRNTPMVRMNNSELSFFILFSLTLCFLCALIFIGEPTTWSCMLRHTAFSITFSLCISCILGKTLVVLAAFTATQPGNNVMKWLGPTQQRMIIFSCTLVQVIICAAWLIASPPFPYKNTQYQRSKIILDCKVGSELAFCKFEVKSMLKEGDFMIGGIFPVYSRQENILHSFDNKPAMAECKGFDLRAFRWTRTMMLAIDEINQDDRLLPNVTLGYIIVDSCSSPTNTLRAALTLMSTSQQNITQCHPPPILALIAESGSTQSIVVAGAIGPFKIPLTPKAVCSEICPQGTRKAQIKGLPRCCFDCIPCADGSISNTTVLWITAVNCATSKPNPISCRLWTNPQLPGIFMNGDFVIGGIFTFHHYTKTEQILYTRLPSQTECYGMDFRELRFARAMEFTIHEINNRTDLLPGIMLGYQIHDSCSTVPMAIRVAFQLANGLQSDFNENSTCSQKAVTVPAIIGDSASTQSISIARVLGLFGIPQVSHYATCSCLSDKTHYPTFFRTIPSDQHQAAALAKMVKYFGWTWIGAVRSDSDYGNYGMAAFLKAAQAEGICVEYSESYYRTQPRSKLARVANVIRRSTARVIIAFMSSGDMKILLAELSRQPPPPLQWIGSETWITDPGILQYNMCAGAIGFGVPRSVIPGLREFLLALTPDKALESPLLTEFWENSFSCKLQNRTGVLENVRKCHGSEDIHTIQNPYLDTSQLRITNMVYKATYAIAHALHRLICNGTQCNKNIQFSPWEPVEFLSWEETLGIILTVFSIAGAVIAVCVGAVFYKHRASPIVKANNSELSFLLLFSLTLCFLCSLTFIGQPSDWSCVLRHTAFGITFVLCISCVLGKTIVVLMAFRATLPGSNVMKCMDFRELRFARAMEFTIHEINNRTDLLPGIMLGYQIHDSCSTVPMAIKLAFQLANGLEPIFNNSNSCFQAAHSAVTAVIGDSASTQSISIARVLGLFGIPQVSHYATCACLSNKLQYPTFFRTIPSDHHQAGALAKMVKLFGWTWIGAVRSDTDYGNNGMASFLKAAQKEGICVEYSEVYYRTQSRNKLERVANVIRRSTARVLVAFMHSGDMRFLLEELARQPPPSLQWIGSETWITDPDFLRYNMCAGAIGFGVPKSVIPGLREFLLELTSAQALTSPLLTEFWESSFGCKLKNQTDVSGYMRDCDGSEDIQTIQNPYLDTSQLRVTNMVYKAAYAIAHAIHGLICNDTQCDKNIQFTPWQMLNQLKLVNFTTKNGFKVSFDPNGDPPAVYELLNWQFGKDGALDFVTVGEYDSSRPEGQEFKMSKNISWLGGQTEPPPPLQWIGSETWIIEPELLRFNMCAGAIGFGIPKSVIPGFREFLLDLTPSEALKSPLLTEFWESSFRCKLKGRTDGTEKGARECDGSEDIFTLNNAYTDTSQLRVTNMVYKATYAIAYAIHGLICTDTQCDKNIKFTPWQCLSSEAHPLGSGQFGTGPAVPEIGPQLCHPLELINEPHLFHIFNHRLEPRPRILSATALISGTDQIASSLNCSSSPPVIGIVGDPGSTHSIAISSVLGLFRVPMSFHQDVQKQLGGCVAYSEILPKDNNRKEVERIVKVIKTSTAKVVVVFSTDAYLVPIMHEVFLTNVTGKQWIASEAWTTSPVFRTSRLLPFLGGTLGIAIRRGEISGLRDFLLRLRPDIQPENNMVRLFWEEMFRCRFKSDGMLAAGEDGRMLCTGHEDLSNTNTAYSDISELRASYNVYKAVYALAYALNDLTHCQEGKGPFNGQSCARISTLQPWQPPRSVCSESCPVGTRKAIKKGMPICCFDCLPCADGEINSNKCILCPEEFWSNPMKNLCVPKEVEFLSYEEPLGISLATASLFGTCFCAGVLLVFVHYRHTPVVRANNSELSFLLLLSLKLCFLCVLLFIGQPQLWTCQLRHVVFGISFVLSVSCILVKTMVVVAVFKSSRPDGQNAMKWFGVAQQRGTVLGLTALQVVICTVWLATASPTPHKNTRYISSKIVFECAVGSVMGFATLLGYIGLLAAVSFLLAFLARNLPDNFNEAKFITFSMLIFCAVWITFVPAYVSSPGKYSVAVEIFAILASSFGLLVAIFAPKCYIILLHPEQNTKKAIMGRAPQNK
ncbi:Vomeronasal type-2 receptor 1 [Bagarius yarrelli]|uniref:Vomeronasal type-2 receptor 1 n=1 Tax=Bagarius yarrelli TaxID=175774 RepID=A0A556TQM2_BAGYA|nr:Vomeronasal type-2 receptor 1 [Bagarius yarrelli]